MTDTTHGDRATETTELANGHVENGPVRSSEHTTRGGTHDQHVTAGKKGGSRIRELIELGYKYEQEHGIGPGRSERAKIAATRRARKDSKAAAPKSSDA